MSQYNDHLSSEGLKHFESRKHLNSSNPSTSTSTNSLFSLHGSSSSSIFQSLSNGESFGNEHEESSSSTHIKNNKYLSQGSSLSIQFGNKRQNFNHKFCVILIGLPATGKSTISRHLITFLHSTAQTSYLRCSIFNAGNARRKHCSLHHNIPYTLLEENRSEDDLFNPKNHHKKEQYAKITLSKLFEELSQDNCDLAIFDATNSTLERRDFIIKEIRNFNKADYDAHVDTEKRSESDEGRNPIHITPIFLQVSCNDPNFIKFNIHNKTFNQDYYDKPYDFAVKDFAKRLQQYHAQFVPFSKPEFDHYCQKNAKANNGAHNPHFGLFCFQIMNAGQSSVNDRNLYYFPSQYCSDTAELINTIEYFIENYTKMYGYQYIERANTFHKSNCESSKEMTEESISVRSSNLVLLNEIINDQYLKVYE